jgi:DNA-binding response OmpR family regulator
VSQSADLLIAAADSPVWRARAELLLASGLSVAHSSTAQAAADHLAASPAQVVLLSVTLEEDADALELARRLRAVAPGARFVLVTGGTDERVAANALRSGFADYLIEPVGDRELTTTVLDLLRAEAPAHEPPSLAPWPDGAGAPLPRGIEAEADTDLRLSGAATLAAELAGELHGLSMAASFEATQVARESEFARSRAAGALVRWASRTALLGARLELLAGRARTEAVATNLAAVVAQVAALHVEALHEANVCLTQDVPAGLPRVVGGDGALRNVLIELLAHAVARARASEGREVLLRGEATGEGARLLVLHTGVGLLPEEADRALAGLGGVRGLFAGGLPLMRCREMLRAVSADLEAVSGIGGRSGFALHLPAAGRRAL